MLSDREYRRKIVQKIQDPVVKAFWVNEFANYSDRFANEAISPIQNKVGQFLSSSVIRNIVAQPKSTIDINEIMDSGKVLIMNLSKGKIGEDNSALLGAMMVTRIQLAAMDRAYIPEKERKDFYLYVDEFQNFATESFASILSEARKYHFNLILAHQYIAQMDETVRDAVFGNAGTLVVYRIGAFDAEYLEKEFAPYFSQPDLVNLDRYNAYIRLMIRGVTSKPFSMRNIPPQPLTEGNRDKVIRVSRERYARTRAIVEDRILRWSSNTPLRGAAPPKKPEEKPQPKPVQKAPRPAKPQKEAPIPFPAVFSLPAAATGTPIPQSADAPQGEAPAPVIADLTAALAEEDQKRAEQAAAKTARVLYDAVCDRCGKATKVPFQPTPGKPVYCPECFAIVKSGGQV